MTDQEMIGDLLERVNVQDVRINEQGQQIELLLSKVDLMMTRLNSLGASHDALSEKFEMFGMSLDAQYQQLATTTAKVEGRNSSAAVKRNMTDDDALRVITGDLKDMDHKEAAEVIGLTYAQVYSCRLEYTFKHVHKQLRDAKIVNKWVKKH